MSIMYKIGAIVFISSLSQMVWSDDKDFLAAREAYQKGDLLALMEKSTQLQGDKWAIYADYYLLHRQLAEVDGIAVINFLQKYNKN